jgi:flavodoxin I
MRILILYYSRTGNTEKMAKAVAEGAQNTGLQVELAYHIEPEGLGAFDAIAVGSPTYHAQMPIDFKSLFEELETRGVTLKGKVGAAFGSYGWSGEAPGAVWEIMKNKLEMRTVEPPLLVKYLPNVKALDACRDLGKKIAQALGNA